MVVLSSIKRLQLRNVISNLNWAAFHYASSFNLKIVGYADDTERKRELERERGYSDLHSFEDTEWRKWKMIETNGECRWRESEKESRCWEGKGGDLPHVGCVQKWRVDEAQMVVCYHGNIGKQGRGKQGIPSISWANHQPKGFLRLWLWWAIYVWGSPEIWSAALNIWNSESSATPQLAQKNIYLPLFFQGGGLLRVRLSFFQSSSLFLFGLSPCLGYHTTLSTHPRGLGNM